MTLWWDMDGTIADLYGVDNWLQKLRAENVTPYTEAKTMQDMRQLARLMNRARQLGYKLGIASWTARGTSNSYNERVAAAKIKWLRKHLPSVNFDFICIVDYGTPKSTLRTNPDDILFDDDANNRTEWGGNAHTPENMLRILRGLN